MGFIFLVLSAATQSQIKQRDGIVVVANIQQTDLSLSQQQIRSLFMGSSLGYKFK
ncbi:MAG: ABC-type phosphate transport system substrate-binding protein, partial [Paraglaciecola sp.]